MAEQQTPAAPSGTFNSIVPNVRTATQGTTRRRFQLVTGGVLSTPPKTKTSGVKNEG